MDSKGESARGSASWIIARTADEPSRDSHAAARASICARHPESATGSVCRPTRATTRKCASAATRATPKASERARSESVRSGEVATTLGSSARPVKRRVSSSSSSALNRLTTRDELARRLAPTVTFVRSGLLANPAIQLAHTGQRCRVAALRWEKTGGDFGEGAGWAVGVADRVCSPSDARAAARIARRCFSSGNAARQRSPST